MLVRLPCMSPDNSAPHAGPPHPAEQVWTTFLHALDSLPADVRLTLLLHDVAGIPLESLIPLLGLPAERCRQHLEAAHACLQDHARHFGATPPCP